MRGLCCLTVLAVLLLVPSEVLAGARQEATVLMSSDPNRRKIQEEWGFADAVVSGDTIFLSGIVAGLRPGETDLTPAYERTFERIGTVLKAAGADWDDVVEITTYHTDLTSQMPAIVAVKQRYVRPPYPAWTAIGVARLIPDRGITEIRIIARRPISGK